MARQAGDRRTREPRRVLIVEDHQDSRDALQLLLTLDGFDVATAADGPGALDAARARPPDIAIVDIGLPGLDGWTVAQILRDELHDLWLVALTSLDSPEDRRHSAAAGFDLHLVKPVWPDELRKAVRVMLLAESTSSAVRGDTGGSAHPHRWSYWMVLPFGAAVTTAVLMARRWTGARHRSGAPAVEVPCGVLAEHASLPRAAANADARSAGATGAVAHL